MLRQLRSRVPFAIVGANSVIEVEGRKVRGRRYPWGIAEGNNNCITMRADANYE